MILTDFFESVVVISLEREQARREAVLRELAEKRLAVHGQTSVCHAWPGDELQPPAWWRAGGGAWGCLQSHVQVLREAWQSGVESVLILEDDCCWQERAVEMLEEFLEQVPGDWDQIYLGGVHQHVPEPVEGRAAVCLGRSVNRTHAYALKRAVIPRVLQHILHAPDYISSSYVRHVDHQLEVAHQRRDWRVYAPTWWIAGQEENQSAINGRRHPRKWWHYGTCHQVGALPFVLIDEPVGDAARWLHSGWDFEEDGESPKDLGVGWVTLGRLHGIMRELGSEAFGMQRLPALAPPHVAGREAMMKGWSEEKVLLLSAVRESLESLCDYPRNGCFEHGWLNAKEVEK